MFTRFVMGLVVIGILSCAGTFPKGAQHGVESGSGNEKDCLTAAASHWAPKANAPARISVAHILVRHAELGRPEGATRTRGQACLRALEAQSKLKDGSKWADVVAKYSDAPGPNSGNLGEVAKDYLDPTFAAAAFSLDVNEASSVVETVRGFHVIIRNK